MQAVLDQLPVLSFTSADELRSWIETYHAVSDGIWVRIYKKRSGVPSVTFAEVLDEGLCFGWSESSRRSYDSDSYLQRFTPRKAVGTQSRRNMERAQALIRAGRMTASGLQALGLEDAFGL